MTLRLRRIWAVLLLGLGPLPLPAAEPVKFSAALYDKFHHPRCLQCHQFNSKRHNGRGFHSHQARYLCDNCHTQRISGLSRGEWMAPAEKLDYTELGPRETCELIKRNLASGDPVQRMSHHLLQDARIRWALENGMTPGGKFPTVPGGYEAWARDAKAWIAGGMLCE